MKIHLAFVSPEHCDVAEELAAVARADVFSSADIRNQYVCARYGVNADIGKPFAYASGVAFVPVHGLLLNRFPGSVGIATGYDFIKSQVRMALADPDVSHIVFDINSNGGLVSGCDELAQEIFRSRDLKPSLAVVDANCYSGAYYLGSAASHIVCTPSGGVGSIGVVAMHLDASKALDEIGLKVTFIYAGDEKVDGNPTEPLSDRAKASIDRTVQYHYGMFTDSVARARGLPVENIRATEARCYTPPEALELGLIDGVIDPGDAVAGFVQRESSMPELSQEEVARIATEAATAAVAADRARMAAIRNSPEAVGREKLADHLALNTTMTVVEATAILSASPKQEPIAGNPFAAAMEMTGNPNVGADNAGNMAGAESTPNRILSNYQAITGYSYRKSA